MSRWFYGFFTIFIFVSTDVTCIKNVESEDQCIDYYKTGENFDLNLLAGDWYAVYYWPPIQRRRSSCEVIKFQKANQSEIEPGCENNLPKKDVILKSSYKNNSGKQTNVYYYGEEEVKHQIRSCNLLSKYIFIKLDDEYVMGINCSSGGRGILLTKNQPTDEEVQDVVEDIDIMRGRQGSPDCPLAR
ncbi:uncharacterized protein LOC113397816 [Vanessa tameamea]|uniref:Uncharacterized protein LOC113397816 n=1 Tax=Vanessa tameamea TaxID=334116 RepID=A0A8B8I562_VANTA|nr:uncharacterized protein LOC113397816 [Vanessa tameamea]